MWRDVIKRIINGSSEGMACVTGCNTENDKWFVWVNGFCERMVCVKGFNTENDKWFVWLSGLCAGIW